MSSIQQTIANAAAANGVPPSLAVQVATQESSLNPNAIGSQGELGLFQLMPSTAAQYGVTDPFDPVQNSNAGTNYLADLFQQFGDWATALTAYNWGPGNVSKYGAAAAPTSTQNYVANALTVSGLSSSSAASSAIAPDDSTDSADSTIWPSDILAPITDTSTAAAPNWLLLAGLAIAAFFAARFLLDEFEA